MAARERRAYGIRRGSCLTYDRIMSIMFYTDYSNLSYEFSASFRKKSLNETNKSLIKRHKNFCNWAKILNETINCWGNRLNYQGDYEWIDGKKVYVEPQISILYHGVSFMHFYSFITRFVSPTSMTRQLEVNIYLFCIKNFFIF